MYKASIKIPSDFSNVSELCNYVQLMYNVRIAPKPNTLDEVVIRTNEGSELEGAQNLALLFIGPESNKVLNLHPDIRELFVLPTIRRYLARGFTLIITVTGDSSLSVRGSRIVVEFFSKALNSVNPSKITSFKNGDLINLCGLHGIDTSQLVNTSKKTRFVLYNFVMELESLVNSYGSSLQDPKNLNQISEPEFVEVFRNSTPKQEACLINVYTAHSTSDKGTIEKRSNSSKRKSRQRRNPVSQGAKARSSTVELTSLVEGPPPPLSVGPTGAVKRNSRASQSQSNGQPAAPPKGAGRLRPVVIDGANVAHGESSNSTFNVNNLRCVIDYFVRRGHQEITVVLPSNGQAQCNNVFSQAEISSYFIFTAIRRLDRSLKVQRTDDDSVILQYALEKDGVIISNDQYRDWLKERPEFRNIIENRVIPYNLRNGTFIISYYPLGKEKPPLDDILAFPNSAPK